MFTVKLTKIAVFSLVFSSLSASAMDPLSGNEIDAAINNLLSVKQVQSQSNYYVSQNLSGSQFTTETNARFHNPYSESNKPQDKKAFFDVLTKSKNSLVDALKGSPPAIAAAHATRTALGKSAGRCALYVRKALNQAGYKNFEPQPSAYMYENVMPKIGFSKIPKDNYTPAVGDVIVWRKKPGNPHGHIQIYNGEYWVSDFKQPNMYIYGQNHNGYTIWRDVKHYTAIADNGLRLAMNGQ